MFWRVQALIWDCEVTAASRAPPRLVPAHRDRVPGCPGWRRRCLSGWPGAGGPGGHQPQHRAGDDHGPGDQVVAQRHAQRRVGVAAEERRDRDEEHPQEQHQPGGAAPGVPVQRGGTSRGRDQGPTTRLQSSAPASAGASAGSRGRRAWLRSHSPAGEWDHSSAAGVGFLPGACAVVPCFHASPSGPGVLRLELFLTPSLNRHPGGASCDGPPPGPGSEVQEPPGPPIIPCDQEEDHR